MIDVGDRYCRICMQTVKPDQSEAIRFSLQPTHRRTYTRSKFDPDCQTINASAGYCDDTICQTCEVCPM